MSDCNNCISYNKSLEYWTDIPATIDGVLGGFGFISNIDIDGSKIFLESLFSSKNSPGNKLALDCGAGIGRITKYLLIPYFEMVDVVEPDIKFINTIRTFIGDSSTKICSIYKFSLQEFKPVKKYDVIWNQWVLCYLKDEDLISYLIRCRNALNENGVIIIKENVSSSGKLENDEIDSSVTRTLKQYLKIFKESNLRRIKQCKQTNFPNGIYPVYMFALVPNSIGMPSTKNDPNS